MSIKKRTELTGFEVAVIGMAGRFPGAKNIREFWNNLTVSAESVTVFTDSELEEAGVEKELLNNPNYIKAKGIVDQADYFDAVFFGYSPNDARVLDPQIRIFTECVWEALEDAGYNPYTYKGSIGLYAGASPNYLWEALALSLNSSNYSEQFNQNQLLEKDQMTTRISYNLNLKGPSISIATACSTSLVAVHNAFRSLLTGECNMALAGGVSLSLPQRRGYFYQEGMLLSPDGHCRAFDARAKGTIWGEGAGVVVLKMLKKAIADGDHIYAVIKGTAVNNDGLRKVGYAAPSVEGQADAIQTAQRISRVEPESISYIETHGTGTILGDPIEIEALKIAFNTDKKQFCRIGSVKTNIGHLEYAAGITGFIKTVLMLKYKQIPPSLNFQTPNPKIDFENSPFLVNTRLTNWQNDDYPLRAGVSSFGIGGTNAHVVLEEAPEPVKSPAGRFWQLLLASAKTETALNKICVNLVEYLKCNSTVNFPDLAYTLAVGRAHFPYRKMFVCTDSVNAIQCLAGQVQSFIIPVENLDLVFMFPGEGSQYPNMGRELYETEPLFREEINHCDEILRRVLNISLKAILYPENAASDEFDDTALTQPVIFSFEYALAELLMKWGLKPQSMIGYGIGEYVAACLAGVFSLEDALTLVVWRGRLMRSMDERAMLDSAMAESALTRLVEKLKQVKFCAPQIPYLSNLTGNWITDAQATNSEYWADHLQSTVNFSDSVSKLLNGRKLLIEIGDGRTLTSFVRQQTTHPQEQLIFNVIKHPGEKISDLYHLLNLVGKLWCHGVHIEWEQFYASERRQRIFLPTYPFERQRFWIDGHPFTQQKIQPESPSAQKKKIMAEWFYLPSWEIIPPAICETQSTERNGSQNFLVFCSGHRFSVHFVERLKLSGINPVIVKPDRKFSELKLDTYSIDPQNESDYEELFRKMAVTNCFPKTIIHLWSITGDNPASASNNLDEFLNKGFYSLLFLAKAMAKTGVDQQLQIIVIANNVQSLTGDENIVAEKATILGPCKVIPQEYPKISCRFLDLHLPEPDSILENELLDNLVMECHALDTEPVVAYRGSQRWAQVFKPILLNHRNFNEDLVDYPSSRLKEKGTYLITGGLGKIGMILARNLAEMVKAKLILIGHSFFPARADWEQWLATHRPDEIISERINKIRELEAIGAEVLVFTSDLSSTEQFEEIVRQAEERFGSINGVIHAAGILSGKTIQEISKSDCENYFLAKIQGLLTLNRVFQHRKLDFGMLMSSLASILGGLGFVAYAAANSFMDVFAQRINPTGKTFWISINWDYWRLTNGNTATNPLEAELERLAITPDEGMKAFRNVLQISGVNQVAVSTVDLQTRIDKWVKLENLRQSPASKPLKVPLYSRPVLNYSYIAPRNETEAKLAMIWQESLGFERVGINDNFFDLGGDSLKAILIVEKAKELDIKIPVTDLFALKTIARIVANVDHGTETKSTTEITQKQSDSPPEESNSLFYTVKESRQYEIDDPEVKILRIKLHREITSFLHYALPLAVILADERLLPWFYEHYIDIFSTTNENGLLKLDFLEYYSPYQKVTHNVCLGYNIMNDISDVVNFITDKINQGFYLIIHLDELYLPVKNQKEHFVHQSLIYGYHNVERKLMAAGFNHEGLFTTFTFDYDQFIEAFEKGKIYYHDTAPWAENNAIELLKLHDYTKEFPFDLKRFVRKLDSYLTSSGNDPIIYTYMLNEAKVTYGINVYDEIFRHLENILKNHFTIDYRSIHFLAEHKKNIFNRLQYIIAKYQIGGDLIKMVQKYYQIVEQFESIRIKFLEFRYSIDSSDIEILQTVVKETIERLKSMEAQERILLSDISKQLKAV